MSSSHTVNRKNIFFVLGEGPTDEVNDSIGATEKKFSINFSIAKTKFCLSLRYNGDSSYLFVNGKKIYQLKASNKNISFPAQFCLGTISENFEYIEPK